MRVVRAPYRICPLGAHIDHQLGPVTALALDRLASARPGTGRVAAAGLAAWAIALGVAHGPLVRELVRELGHDWTALWAANR